MRFGNKQRTFLDLVLTHYVSAGEAEPDKEKLPSQLRLLCRDSLADAIADLGKPEEIGKAFSGFQKCLYETTGAP